MMGLDFMKRHNCSIDIAKNVLTIQSKTVDLKCQGSIGCYRITVAEDVSIPARSEVIIQGDVPSFSRNDEKCFLVEPSDRIMQSGKGLLAKTLVNGSSKVPLRILNVSDVDQMIYQGTHIGHLSPVSEIKNKNTPLDSKGIPDHLIDLYERTVSGMTRKRVKM